MGFVLKKNCQFVFTSKGTEEGDGSGVIGSSEKRTLVQHLFGLILASFVVFCLFHCCFKVLLV